MIYVAPTEPASLKAVGASSALPETFGSDLLVFGGETMVGMQRKTWPGDFLASVSDGRFTTSSMKMLKLPHRFLLLEGHTNFTRDGAIVGETYGEGRRFTRGNLWGMLWSLLFEFDIVPFWTASTAETAEFVVRFEEWLGKPEHSTGRVRVGLSTPSGRTAKPRDMAAFLLQGFPGIGPTVAEAIFDTFERVPLRFDVTRDEMKSVPGVGEGRLNVMSKLVPFEDD